MSPAPLSIACEMYDYIKWDSDFEQLFSSTEYQYLADREIARLHRSDVAWTPIDVSIPRSSGLQPLLDSYVAVKHTCTSLEITRRARGSTTSIRSGYYYEKTPSQTWSCHGAP